MSLYAIQLLNMLYHWDNIDYCSLKYIDMVTVKHSHVSCVLDQVSMIPSESASRKLMHIGTAIWNGEIIRCLIVD